MTVFESTRHRPLTLRHRSDLTVVRQTYQNELFYLIKDPLEMEFYRLNEEEFAVLNLVDGERSLDEIKSEFEANFPSQRITHRQLQTYISELRKKSLLRFLTPDIGPHLVERAKEKKAEKLKKNLGSILSFKWRGVDPDRFLNWITPLFGIFFSAPLVWMCLLFEASALLTLLANYSLFESKLPNLSDFLSGHNIVLLGLSILVMKVIHELAHGVSFKRYGGECHEIGVMLIMFIIPTLYCNTTDSWLLKNKWKRAAIGAAGIHVELFIAACATYLWWYTSTGNLNLLCLNIMATGTLSAVVMNANPFFKLDGYYIFSDIFELPNLRERAGKLTQAYFLKYCLGIDEKAEQNSTREVKRILLTYQLLSFVVKLLVILFIKVMLIDRLNEYGLGYLALSVGLVSLGALLVPPCWNLYKFFKVPGRIQRIEMRHSLFFVCAVSIIGFILVAIPFPHHVSCPLTIEMQGRQPVYVKHAANLKQLLVRDGESVNEGQQLVELEGLPDTLELQQLDSKIASIKAELELIERTRDSASKSAKRVSELREQLATNQAKWAELKEVVSSFQIFAPRDGIVVSEYAALEDATELTLRGADGVLLSERNIGSALSAGTKLCSVGDLKNFQAVLAVNEHDIAWLKEEQRATIILNSFPSRRISSSIASLARKESEDLPSSLTKKHGGTINLDAQKDKEKKAVDEHFEARLPLPESGFQLSEGLRGHARIRVGSLTLMQRAWLMIHRSLRKRLH